MDDAVISLRLLSRGLSELIRIDKESALCLLEWATRSLEREAERRNAARTRRAPGLVKIELCQPEVPVQPARARRSVARGKSR
jgi:hypothetical protein